MTSRPSAPHPEPLVAPPAASAKSPGTWLVIPAVLLVSVLAISGRSLWIDEACTAMKVLPDSLSAWWIVFSQDRSADLQMPLYMFYMWGWCRLFGTSEWSLHAANAPWFVLGVTSLALAFPANDRRRLAVVTIALLCPFAWYYLDEARPYSMQLGAALLTAGGLIRLQRLTSASTGSTGARGAGPIAAFALGISVLSGSSLTGMIWAGGALLALPAALSFRTTLGLLRGHWQIWAAAGVFLALFALFYLWTLTLGARASASATTTLGSSAFIAYELLGFSGLGPGRLDLRVAGAAALKPFLPWLALYAAGLILVLGEGLREILKRHDRRVWFVALCSAAPAAFILLVGVVAHFRALGRHFTPLLSVVLLLLGLGLAQLWSRRRAWSTCLAFVFCGLSLASCLSLRLASHHQKDNYRAAAAAARTALSHGKLVWWNAAVEGARYYHVPLSGSPGDPPAAVPVLNPTPAMLAQLPRPQVVVASKPDVYDGASALGSYLRSNQFTPAASLTAFVIWKPTEP